MRSLYYGFFVGFICFLVKRIIFNIIVRCGRFEVFLEIPKFFEKYHEYDKYTRNLIIKLIFLVSADISICDPLKYASLFSCNLSKCINDFGVSKLSFINVL